MNSNGQTNKRRIDVAIIGGGQSGLALAYFLRRSELSFVILDEQEKPGGAWQHGWKSLRLFSPVDHSSLPGWLMPRSETAYPSREHVIEYLAQYEARYQFPVERPVKVRQMRQQGLRFQIDTNQGMWESAAVVSATGNWSKPYIPPYSGIDAFRGLQIHSAFYQQADDLTGRKVLIVGGGNSGAQILAEVSKRAHTTWVTEKEPTFLPDEVDGRYLFEFATRQYHAQREGKPIEPIGGLGDVVMVESVKEARNRGVLQSVRPFLHFTGSGVVWPDGKEEAFDAVIWCTGFRPALDYLKPLEVLEPDGRVIVKGTQSVKMPRLWLVGYGSWTGYASATLIGVGRTARSTAEEIIQKIKPQTQDDSNTGKTN